MTHTTQNAEVFYLLGSPDMTVKPLRPFDAGVCRFLADLSAALRSDPRAKEWGDLQTFAFWCRAGNLEALKTRFDTRARLGRGLVFHIAPSNVPINAAFSYAFALLAGNASLVRLPMCQTLQIQIFCDIMQGLLDDPRHAVVRARTAFVRYAHDAHVTAAFSARCQARVIWGGDATISEIRQMPLPPRAVELAFADRTSLCLMRASAVVAATDEERRRLAEAFYNDAYVMDQNACSSPQLVLWQGQGEEVAAAKALFWPCLCQVAAARYAVLPTQAVEKYCSVLDAIVASDGLSIRRYGAHVEVAELSALVPGLDALRGKFGLFFEGAIDTLEALKPIITEKVQTLTYFGAKKESLRSFVIDHGLTGIDRIVPVGEALAIDVIWDGYDVLAELSRLVDAR